MKIKYKKFDFQRKFGVEMEIGNEKKAGFLKKIIKKNTNRKVLVTGYEDTINNDYWHVKKDSTCGKYGANIDYGFEVNSFVASGINDLLEIARMADSLSQNGVLVNKNCGLHIHVDISDFAKEQVWVLLAYWLKIEYFILQMVPIRRVNNIFCKIMRTNDTCWEGKYFDFERYFLDFLGDRRVTLNLNNYLTRNNRKTVELRLPEGILCGMEIKNWVRFFVNFIENCKIKKMPKNLTMASNFEEVMTILGLHHDKNFYIFSEGLYETKIWIMNRIMSYCWGDSSINNQVSDFFKLIKP